MIIPNCRQRILETSGTENPVMLRHFPEVISLSHRNEKLETCKYQVLCVCVCVCACARARARACVCASARTCVCACVCVRACVRVRVCACVRVCVCVTLANFWELTIETAKHHYEHHQHQHHCHQKYFYSYFWTVTGWNHGTSIQIHEELPLCSETLCFLTL